MKRNQFLKALLCCGFIFITSPALALTIASGSFDFLNLPENSSIGNYGYGTTYTDPDTGENVRVNTLFGWVSAYDKDTYTYPYHVAGALDPDNDYKGSQSYEQTIITGQHHQDTGSKEFTASAQTTSPGKIEARANIGFNSHLEFTGSLSDFGYDYSFEGNKDSDDDMLGFIVQMEIAYYDETKENSWERWVKVYSDYWASSDEFDARNNWVHLMDVESGAYSGTRTFDYSEFGERRWSVRWDFGGYAYDNSVYMENEDHNPVPEPATMVLFGIGLIGLAGVSRKKRLS